MKTANCVLVLHCPDLKGIVAAVTSFIALRDLTIEESSQFKDAATGRFFMRVALAADPPRALVLEEIRTDFANVAEAFEMEWEFHDAEERPRVLIAVSKLGHCLYELMHRWRAGQLPVEIVAVLSNHEDMRSFVEWNSIPFHLLPVTPETRQLQENRILGLVDELKIDFVVLARYMQILSPALCAALQGRCINIHHSFLPSFRGARPYHQAHARGVKMIGATAHYVTDELDEGPIIAQDVRPVSHAHTPEQMVALGKEAEAAVLARAVAWQAEHRIIANGAKTVIFG